MIALDKADMAQDQSREWLETNGLGGYASSTMLGANTRRYHGLLVAALHPPADRFVLLSKLEETLETGAGRFELSTNQYPGAIHPHGYQYFRRFRLDLFPSFVYAAGEVMLEKTVFMPHGENTVVVQYRVLDWGALAPAQRQCRLELRPLLAFRGFHELTRANGALRANIQADQGTVSMQPYDSLPRLYFAHDADAMVAGGDWYYNFEYAVERERGLDFQEDLFNPFQLTFELNETRSIATVVASLAPRQVSDVPAFKRVETERRRSIATPAVRAGALHDDSEAMLRRAADQFLVSRGEHSTVIAGYHWFGDWGRDTMIALPGLTLTTGRHDLAREVLLTYASRVDQGMLPNRFPDRGEAPEYNAADATLWFFYAAHAYLRATGDFALIRKLLPVFADIIAWHIRGARHGIRVDDDGLLHAGEPGVQLTWMDARVNGRVITPRIGKPVEIQALWHNALRVMADLSRQDGDTQSSARYAAMAEKTKLSFGAKFWNPTTECLFDVIDCEPLFRPNKNGVSAERALERREPSAKTAVDPSIRPNQLFAISLPFALLEGPRAKSVLKVAIEQLLTPYGLRTLSPHDPRFCGRYEGGVESRDSAYHQGTVWPWLLGPFITAYRKTYGHSEETAALGIAWLQPILDHMTEAGVCQISEVFDGDAPHRPGGCIAQAWSVAEVLRCLVEELGDPPDPAAKKAV